MFEGGRAGMHSIRCQFCDRTSTMFSVFIYVESKICEELVAKGEYPYTWHPAKIQDPEFQKALNIQRGRQIEEDTRKKEGIVRQMKADSDARRHCHWPPCTHRASHWHAPGVARSALEDDRLAVRTSMARDTTCTACLQAPSYIKALAAVAG
eukprot:1829828-Amphidinium_carterae.1